MQVEAHIQVQGQVQAGNREGQEAPGASQDQGRGHLVRKRVGGWNVDLAQAGKVGKMLG
jgi:hypothetical protein